MSNRATTRVAPTTLPAVGAALVVARFCASRAPDRIDETRHAGLRVLIVRREQGDHKGRPYIILTPWPLGVVWPRRSPSRQTDDGDGKRPGHDTAAPLKHMRNRCRFARSHTTRRGRANDRQRGGLWDTPNFSGSC